MADSLPAAAPAARGPQEWAALVARRRWLIGGAVVVVWALACGLAFWLPPRYQSRALLLIRQPQVPAAVVGGRTGAENTELEHITQQVLSQPRLAALAQRLGVLQPPAATPAQAAERMQQAVRLDWVAAPGQRPGDAPAALTVAFTARTAELAQAVDQQLVRWLVRTNRQTRQAQAAGAADFLTQAVAASGTTLASAQQALRAFEAQHPDLDPAQAAGLGQRLAQLEAELAAARQALDQAQQQQLYLTSLSAAYRGLLNEPARGGAGTALDQRIGLLQSQLAALQARYTDQYPEVQRLQSELAAARQEQRSGARAGSAGATSPAQVAALTPWLQIASQVRSNQMALRDHRQQLAALGRQIAALQAEQNAAPALEPELQSRQQAVAQAESQYSALAAEQHQAGLAVALQRGPQGAQFRVLDPPALAARPVFPNKLLFSGLGLAAGAVLGLLLALAVEWGDDRLHNAAEVKDWALAPLLGVIPVLATAGEQRRAARRRGWQWALASALVVIVASSNWWLVLHP